MSADQLKVAPEHCSAPVLRCMGKPPIATYKKFQKRFYELTKSAGKKQYLVPYLMSSHPGSTMRDAIELAVIFEKGRIAAGAGTGFLSHPGHGFHLYVLHRAGSLYHGKGICAAHAGGEGRAAGAASIFPAGKSAAGAGRAEKAGRTDLIGTGPDCLVADDRPRGGSGRRPAKKGKTFKRR